MEYVAVLPHWPIEAVVAIVAGIVVLVAPRVLNYAVAAYLLIAGTLGLLHSFHGHAFRLQPVLALVAGVIVLIKPTVLNYVVGIYLIVIGLLDLGILRF